MQNCSPPKVYSLAPLGLRPRFAYSGDFEPLIFCVSLEWKKGKDEEKRRKRSFLSFCFLSKEELLTNENKRLDPWWMAAALLLLLCWGSTKGPSPRIKVWKMEKSRAQKEPDNCCNQRELSTSSLCVRSVKAGKNFGFYCLTRNFSPLLLLGFFAEEQPVIFAKPCIHCLKKDPEFLYWIGWGPI